MKKLIFFLVFVTSCYSNQHLVLPNMIPNIIIELFSNLVYQSMSQADKIRCAVISNYLEIQTRYFLIANPKFSKAIENFAISATNNNCQEILNQLANIIYSKRSPNLHQQPIDYNYLKSMLFSQQNSLKEKAYLNLVIMKQSPIANGTLPQYWQPNYFNLIHGSNYALLSQNKQEHINLTDLVSQKIKDALTPSSKDDLKKIEIIYNYIIKKTASWLINFKNFVK
jgi:hypothetical protein